jgi:hypothetical protein
MVSSISVISRSSNKSVSNSSKLHEFSVYSVNVTSRVWNVKGSAVSYKGNSIRFIVALFPFEPSIGPVGVSDKIIINLHRNNKRGSWGVEDVLGKVVHPSVNNPEASLSV